MIKRTTVHYPDAAIAARRQRLGSEYRAWLAFRAFSFTSHISVKTLLAEFSSDAKKSNRLFGRKRMYQVLRKGEGIFWKFDFDRKTLTLIGKDRVAENLGVENISFRPVRISTEHVLKSYKQTQAAILDSCYASFKNPISRDTIYSLTGFSQRNQIDLEKLMGNKPRPNILVVDSNEDSQNTAWEHGHTFRVLDRKGTVTGEACSFYTAKKLPNTYRSTQNLAGHRSAREYNRRNQQREGTSSGRKYITGTARPKRTRLYSTPSNQSRTAIFSEEKVVMGYSRDKTRMRPFGVFVKAKFS